MQNLTHTFKLPSGVEVEVKEMIGKHQRLLTEQSKLNHTDKLYNIMADVIVRVGSKTKIDIDFVKSMLTCDFKSALVQVRQFTLGFEKQVKFEWDYKNIQGKKITTKQSVDVPDGEFPIKPVSILNENGEAEPAQYTEYDEIVRDVYITLPSSGQKVRFTMCDGVAEERASKTPKNKRSSHTIIKMRKPVFFEKTDNGETPVSLDLDKISYRDIEFLKSKIKEVEGQVDTEVMFDHPEADNKPVNEQDVVVDLLGLTAFFFPSEVI